MTETETETETEMELPAMRTTGTSPRTTRARPLAGLVALSLLTGIGLASPAWGLPPPQIQLEPPSRPELEAERDEHHRKKHERREALLRRIRVLKTVELGEALELDSEAMVRLTRTLAPFDDEREKLRLENLELNRALRKLAKGEATGDATTLAKRVAENRVRLAEIDRRELAAVLAQIPPQKAASAALFLAEFPRRMERLADEVKHGKHHRRKKDHRDRHPHRKHHDDRED